MPRESEADVSAADSLPAVCFGLLKITLDESSAVSVFDNPVTPDDQADDSFDILLCNARVRAGEPRHPEIVTCSEVKFIDVLEVQANIKDKSRLRRDFERELDVLGLEIEVRR